MAHKTRDAAYYQRLHDQPGKYQDNNWLLDELDTLRTFGAKTILELGCGNGRFLAAAAPHFERVYGCDWAKAPNITAVLAKPNITFLRADLLQGMPPVEADLVVSADFLEHLPPKELTHVLAKISRLSERQFHKIACYDDGHSHLSVYRPAQWLALWRSVNPAIVLERHDSRPGRPDQPVAVFTAGRDSSIPA